MGWCGIPNRLDAWIWKLKFYVAVASLPSFSISYSGNLCFIPTTLGSIVLKVLAYRGGNASTKGTARIPLKVQLHLALSSLQVIDPDYQEEVDLMLHKRGEEEYVWHQGDSFECFLVPLYLVLMVN